MPKLVSPISAPRQTGGYLKKYICHPNVLKNMINNLNLMEHRTPLQRENYQIQAFKILDLLYDWYRYNGENVYMHFITSLFEYLGGVGYLERRELRIFNFNNPSAELEFNTTITSQKLDKIKKAGSEFYIVSVVLFFENQADTHQNLLIISLKQKIAYRIEPNYGKAWDQFSGNYVNVILKTFCKERLKVSFLGEYPGHCSYLSWIIPPKVKTIPHSGLCMFISVGRYVYGNALTEDILIKFIVNFYKNEMKKICG